MKKNKNYIIASVIIVFGLITCAIAINTGGQQQMIENGMGDSQQSMGMGMDENNPVAGETIIFKTTDLDGNTIDDSIFNDYRMTIVNLWATFCEPCIEEMPEIQKIQDEYKDQLKVIGIVEEYDQKDAKDILKSINVTYTNVVADENLQNILNNFQYIPVTLFVDSEGKIIDTFIPGSTDYQSLKSMVDGLLK